MTIDLFEAIRTTRAMRRLDPERTVSDADVRTILEAALRGPTGGNAQPLRWLVIRDAEIKKHLQEIYARCWSRGRAPYVDKPGVLAPEILTSADHLAAHLHESPVLVLACADAGPTKRRFDASVYPSVQNLLLAARGLGLGTTLTTAHLLAEDAVKELLGIPEHVSTYALVPVGYPLGKWGEAKRKPLDEVSFHDRWGHAGPDAGSDA